MFDFKGEHILTAHTIPAAIQTSLGLDKRERVGMVVVCGGVINIVWGSVQ